MYNKVVLNLFNNPANAGRISKPDGIADLYNENQTAHIEFSLRVESDLITDCKFRAQANPYIIAICSTITNMVKGKLISMVFLDPYGIKEQLGDHTDLDIMFCINCLKLAIDDYKIKLQKKDKDNKVTNENVTGEKVLDKLLEDELIDEQQTSIEDSKARLENVFNLLNIKPSEESFKTNSEDDTDGKDSLDDFDFFDDDDFGEDF